MSENTEPFTIDDIELRVRPPSVADLQEATKVYNGAFTDAIDSRAMLRAKLDDFLTSQGLWNKEKEKKLTDLQQELLSGERTLAKGGIKLSDAKKLALKMRGVRDDIRKLVAIRAELDNNTAEGQADNAKFNFLVSRCLVYNENEKPYYQDVADYLSHGFDPIAREGAQRLLNIMYGLDSNVTSKLPENKFLKQFKFVDDKLRLVNEDGHLIDSEGRLIDEEGRYVDKEGNYVDIDGNPLTEDGDYAFEQQPFLNDDGEPIVIIDDDTVEEIKTKKK